MYQFLHIETYPLHARYNKSEPEKSVKSFVSVARELMRHPSAVPHIHAPKPPRILYGYCAYTALKLAQDRVNASKDALGRKIRKDAKVILSGVISCPSDFKYNSEKNYQRWLSDNVAYLQDKYGGQLISVILHEDESHPHIHFICVPKQSNDFRLHIKTIHEPIRAREEAVGGRKVKYEAYKSAFRKLQDEYYYKVASKFGFLRDGAKQQRLTRNQYIRRKVAAKNLSNFHHDLLNKFQECLNEKNNIKLGLDDLHKKEVELKNREDEIIESKKDLVNITKITKERENDMLFLFKRKKCKSNEIEYYKNKTKSLQAMLSRLKYKVSSLKSLIKEYKDKIHKQSFEIDCLKTRVKDLEREKYLSIYNPDNNAYSGSNVLSPRQEIAKEEKSNEINVPEQRKMKPNRREQSLDFEP
ncbi:TPA: plasmid recombination protein [Vibrio parahaemolyticus]|nr:plasmid recombination protein [Vibrio parahaemolyticus]